jgi:hypothetical protein
MAQRDKSDLYTLYADNDIGAISPADLRDFVESVNSAHGSYYVTVPAATVPSIVGTYQKVNGVTAAVDSQALFTHSTNRLTYNGTKDIHCDSRAGMTLTVAGNNKTVGFAFAVNGVVLAHTIMHHRTSSSTDVVTIAIAGDFTLAPGDYVEIWGAGIDDATPFTAQRMYVALDGSLV